MRVKFTDGSVGDLQSLFIKVQFLLNSLSFLSLFFKALAALLAGVIILLGIFKWEELGLIVVDAESTVDATK